MSTQESVSFSLEVNVEGANQKIRELETILYRTLSVATRLTGDANLKRGIQTIQRTIMALNSLRLAYRAVHLARAASGDPIAWGLAAVAIAEGAVYVYDIKGS